jgi:hypothetical protein
VVSLIPEERKIGLSIRRVRDDEAADIYSANKRQQRARTGTVMGDVLMKTMGEELSRMGVVDNTVPGKDEKGEEE